MSEDVDEPVHLVEHDPGWTAAAAELVEHLVQLLPQGAVVEHIGSTAVPGLAAKPVLDLLVGVRDLDDVDAVVATLVCHGWTSFGEAGVPGRQYLRRRGGRRDANVHVTRHGSELWRDDIALRDHLRRSSGARERYAGGKRQAVSHGERLIAYSAGKAALVQQLLTEARGRP